MSKPVIGIQLEFGFHEIKKYIHSGFATKLSGHFDIVWFAIDKKNIIFNEYFQSTGFPIVFYSEKEMHIQPSRWEKINQMVRRSWMKKYRLGMFHNYRKVEERKRMDILLGNNWMKWLMERITLSVVKKRYIHSVLMTDFGRHGVQMVFSTGYASSFAKSFYVSAHQSGLPCHYLVNSWKDLYTDNFIPFSFLKDIFVWDESMKEKYHEHMPYISDPVCKVSGNPTFDVLMDYKPSKDRRYYSEKYQLSESAHWFLYTMMPPGLVNDEIERVKLVSLELLKKYSSDQVALLVRINPNHRVEDFIDLDLPVNTKIAEHFCRFDAVTDMIVQTREGEMEWFDLLSHCQANVSVPSTVTMEFITMSKPVMNIEFDQSGQPDKEVAQHFNAGFYRDLFQRDDIYRITTIGELLPVVDVVLQNKMHPASNRQRAAEIIMAALS